MKVVYVCRHLNLFGGQSRIAWELARRARADGHEAHLVGRRNPGAGTDGLPAHRVFQWPKVLGFGGAFRFKRFAEASSKRAERLCADGGVVHGFGDSYRQDVLTLGNVDWNYARHIPGRLPDRTAIHIKKEAFLDPGLKFLVLVSHQMREDLADLLPEYDASKVRVIYPGVDVEKFSSRRRAEGRARLARERGVDPGKKWIVFAAGGDFEKRNVGTLAKALARLRGRDDWRFLFVGADRGAVPWPAELESRTHFLGRLGDVSRVMPACDLMAYPAWYDEAAMVCLEAMASGLPIAISRKVGVSQVVSEANKSAAVLRDIGGDAELAAILQRLLDDDGLRKKMGADNEKAARSFSWDSIYRQYKSLYEEAAAAA